jgi:hypothetical protein
VLAAAIAVASACGSSDLQRTAQGAAGELSASARTLEAYHQDRLTRQYAQGAFVNYDEQLATLDQASLPADLRARWTAARPAVSDPCLDAGCDWQAQVRALDDAAAAFRRAADG